MFDDSLKDKNMIIIETFNDDAYVFDIIKINDEYFLTFNNMKQKIKKLVIRPNFWIFFEDGSYDDFKYILKSIKQELTLIKNYYIDPTIFQKLVMDDVITYTIGVADMYDLPKKYAKDYEYHHNDYSRKDSKEKVLTKLKNGIFN